jgi:hypothetical protein
MTIPLRPEPAFDFPFGGAKDISLEEACEWSLFFSDRVLAGPRDADEPVPSDRAPGRYCGHDGLPDWTKFHERRAGVERAEPGSAPLLAGEAW